MDATATRRGAHGRPGRGRPVPAAVRRPARRGHVLRQVPRRDGDERRRRRRPARAPQRGPHQGRRGRLRRLRPRRRWRASASTPPTSARRTTCRPRSSSARSTRPRTRRCCSTASPIAPDLTLTGADVPWDLVARRAAVLGHRHRHVGRPVPADPARHARRTAAGPGPGTGRFTVLDLDWRPMFWPSPHAARREYVRMLAPRERRRRQPRRGRGRRRHPRPRGGRPPAARPRRRAGPGQAGRGRRARRDRGRHDHRAAPARGGRLRARRRRRVRRRPGARPARRLGPGTDRGVRQRGRRDRRDSGSPAPTRCRPWTSSRPWSASASGDRQ